MKRWIVSNGLICMVVILVWFGNSGAQELIDDGSTQCFGMHCCPSGYAMRGARLDSNRFLCRPIGVRSEDCFVDVPTKREGLAAVYAGVHACPTGTYMRGLHEDRGLLTCCFDRERGYSSLINERVDPDPGHQEHGMHACPAAEGNAVMTGIDIRNNHFLCSTPESTSPITDPVISSQNPETSRSFLPANPSRFPMWQRETRNWLARLMNLPINYLTLPAPTCQVQDRDVLEGGVQRLKITYPSPVDGLPITAHMLFPPGYGSTSEMCSGSRSTTAQFPAILITHGHFASKDSSSHEWTSYFRGVGLFLAQNGFVVLAPDTRGFGQYRMPGISGDTSLPNDAHHNQQLLRLGANGRLPQIYLVDNVQSISLLLATPKVNRERVANAGLSLGGFQALWLGALDTRLNTTIVAGQLLSLFCQNNPAVHHACQTVPGLSLNIDQPWLSTLIDTEDLAALIAPRKFYPMWGMTDANDGPNSRCKENARNATRAVYAAARVPDQLWLPPDIPGMGHDWDLPNTLQFLTGAVTPFKISYGNESDRWSYSCNGPNGMHCCGPGQALVGLKVNVNRAWYFWQQDFMCRNVTTPENERCQVVDYGSITRSTSAIAACPPGQYLKGIGWNSGTSMPRDFTPRQFWCCQDVSETRSQLLRSEVVDPPRAQMMGYHVCELPESQIMTGFAKPPTPFANGTTNDNANNQLLCSGP